MTALQQLMSSAEAPNTIVMMTAADLKKLIDDTNAYTRKCVEESFQPHYYDTKDLMNLFHVSRTTIFNWDTKGYLPESYTPEGTDKKLWKMHEIHEWIDAGKLGRYIHK